MSTKSTNLKLDIWNDTDLFDVDQLSGNFNTIDNLLGKDYVVENGTNDYWTWRKWASGRCELWGTSAHVNIPDTQKQWQEYGRISGVVTIKTGYVNLGSPKTPFKVKDPHVMSISPIVKPNADQTGYGVYYASPRYSTSESPDSSEQTFNFDLVTLNTDDQFHGIIRYYVTGWWE